MKIVGLAKTFDSSTPLPPSPPLTEGSMVAMELLRWGIVHRNVEYYTQPQAFFGWFTTELNSELLLQHLRDVQTPIECYQKIIEYYSRP
ncbi:MAG TPA: hypothetical protein VJI15_01760 [Candidatus Nanoarchaeia archaeon]|nr:hypothetical protein [Candidatus Nanoarchaeia archaeon]